MLQFRIEAGIKNSLLLLSVALPLSEAPSKVGKWTLEDSVGVKKKKKKDLMYHGCISRNRQMGHAGDLPHMH